MSQLNPAFVQQVAKISAALDGLNYFQLLRIDYDAGAQEIRAGYHSQARIFHPDRYAHMDEPELLKKLSVISKRITEAYVTLRDQEKRTHYLKMIQASSHRKPSRYNETHEQTKKNVEQSRSGTTDQGRKMYAQAVAAWQSGRSTTAIKTLKMALVYESGNTSFQDLLKQWQTQSED